MKKKVTQIIELQQSDFLAEMHSFASFLKQQLENKIDKDESSHFYHTILSEAIYELHKMLRKYKIFDDAVHIAENCCAVENAITSYQKLIATDFLQTGLVTLYHERNMPLHDHPGAYGTQYILSGKVHIQQYQHISDIEIEQSIVRLDKVGEYNLVKNNMSIFQPFEGNIHQLNSNSKRSVVLSMIIHPCKYQQRSWYFPMTDLIGSNETLFNRIKNLGQSNNEK